MLAVCSVTSIRRARYMQCTLYYANIAAKIKFCIRTRGAKCLESMYESYEMKAQYTYLFKLFGWGIYSIKLPMP